MVRPDADVWHVAMDREHSSLMECSVFKPAHLPAGHKAIGVCWVYAYKYHPDGSIIKGKEKARLVAQGFVTTFLILNYPELLPSHIYSSSQFTRS